MRGSVGIKVWDLPTRLFHWLLVLLFAFSWWSAENRHMDWHYLSGLTLLGLLTFRLLWGLFGSSTARLGALFASPRAVWTYLRGRSTVEAGHNPLGGYSVLAMLGLLATQIGSGLFATDVDGLESGPFSFLVTFDQGRLAAAIHSTSFNLLIAMIALHILAILFHLLFRRRNLVGPMLTGCDRSLAPGTAAVKTASTVRFLTAAVIASLLAWAVSRGLWL